MGGRTPLLSPDRREAVNGFGAVRSTGYVYRPATIEGIREVFSVARSHGRTVVLRGAGRSYGDASVNPEGIVLELTRFNRVLEWCPETGVVVCESGVTVGQLWQHVIGDGWWPPVVPGTMAPTLGGALGANIHGKNNVQAGVVGDHVLWFELLTPAGALIRCSREERGDLFHAAIGGFGLLGVFTRIALQLGRVHSGLLEVQPYACANLSAMLRHLEERKDQADYLVGWLDAFTAGDAMGRGLVHEARHLPAGADHNPAQTMRPERQRLPDTLFGFIPRAWLWRGLRMFLCNAGMRLVNWVKWFAGRRAVKPYRQSHAAFHFLLDYVPGWQRAYEPDGLIQFQTFIPLANAEAVFARQLTRAQEEGQIPYLAVMKRHRPDAFLLSHGVDGYSLALDFKVTARNREGLETFLRSLALEAVAAGGRFYLAKDAVLTAELFASSLPKGALASFAALKAEIDPEGLLEGAMARRLRLI